MIIVNDAYSLYKQGKVLSITHLLTLQLIIINLMFCEVLP